MKARFKARYVVEIEFDEKQSAAAVEYEFLALLPSYPNLCVLRIEDRGVIYEVLRNRVALDIALQKGIRDDESIEKLSVVQRLTGLTEIFNNRLHS